MKNPILCLALASLPVAVSAAADDAGVSHSHRPEYTADGRLRAPADYREWIYLSSGLDMSYRERPGMADHSMFDNVFVNPESYRAFVRTGTWPDQTMLVMEVRGAASKGSINQRGKFQTADRMGVEVHVKDKARFEGGWAFFAFGGDAPATRLPETAECYACHGAHGAVDTTFVQFYPTLLGIATRDGTLSAAYLEESKAEGTPAAGKDGAKKH